MWRLPDARRDRAATRPLLGPQLDSQLGPQLRPQLGTQFGPLPSLPAARFGPEPYGPYLAQLRSWAHFQPPAPHALPARARLRCGCAAHSLPLIAFLGCAAIYLSVGLFCLFNSHEFPARGASEAFFGADCWAADRRADHVEARVYIGTPPELYRLLVRTDASLQCGAGAGSFPPITLFSAKSLHSRSADCVDGLAGKRCYDVVLVNRWDDPGHGSLEDLLSAEGSRQRLRNTRAELRRALRPIAFAYGADQLAGSEALELGLDGEIYLCRGASYALSAREFCAWAAPGAAHAGAYSVKWKISEFHVSLNQSIPQRARPAKTTL